MDLEHRIATVTLGQRVSIGLSGGTLDWCGDGLATSVVAFARWTVEATVQALPVLVAIAAALVPLTLVTVVVISTPRDCCPPAYMTELQMGEVAKVSDSPVPSRPQTIQLHRDPPPFVDGRSGFRTASWSPRWREIAMLRRDNNLRGALAVLAVPLCLDLKIVITSLKILWKGQGDTDVSAPMYCFVSINCCPMREGGMLPHCPAFVSGSPCHLRVRKHRLTNW